MYNSDADISPNSSLINLLYNKYRFFSIFLHKNGCFTYNYSLLFFLKYIKFPKNLDFIRHYVYNDTIHIIRGRKGYTMERNFTSGSTLKNILIFSLPYLLSYFLQSLYGMADLFIIGQFGSVSDITAVSVGSQVMHMVTVMLVGLSMGTTVTISRNIGANDRVSVSNTVGNTITVFAVLSAALTILLYSLAEPLARLMSTPAEAFSGTVSYIKICFIGIPFITAYNIISAIFRGLGDTKSPMYFIAVACIANILLDILFMGRFNMGPAGAALGTTLSQLISVMVSAAFIAKKDVGIRISKASLKPMREAIGQILRVGAPISLQDGFIQVSFLVITVIANKRGLNDAAAVGIVEKIIGILFLVPSTMLSAVSAIGAQNIGAGKYDRAKLTLRYAIFIAVSFGIVVTVITQFFSVRIVGLFDNDKNVMLSASQYLKSYVWDCILAGISFSFSGYFCASEKSGLSFLHNLISILAVRIPVAYFMSAAFENTLFPMGLASPLGSLVSVVVCIIFYKSKLINS